MFIIAGCVIAGFEGSGNGHIVVGHFEGVGVFSNFCDFYRIIIFIQNCQRIRKISGIRIDRQGDGFAGTYIIIFKRDILFIYACRYTAEFRRCQRNCVPYCINQDKGIYSAALCGEGQVTVGLAVDGHGQVPVARNRFAHCVFARRQIAADGPTVGYRLHRSGGQALGSDHSRCHTGFIQEGKAGLGRVRYTGFIAFYDCEAKEVLRRSQCKGGILIFAEFQIVSCFVAELPLSAVDGFQLGNHCVTVLIRDIHHIRQGIDHGLNLGYADITAFLAVAMTAERTGRFRCPRRRCRGILFLLLIIFLMVQAVLAVVSADLALHRLDIAADSAVVAVVTGYAFCGGHITAAFRMYRGAVFVGFRTCTGNLLHSCRIAAAAVPADMGAVSAGHSCCIAALSGVLRVMFAQIVLSGKRHHGEILHQHTQAKQSADPFFHFLINAHIVSSFGESMV